MIRRSRSTRRFARELDDRPLLARALTACVGAAAFDAEAALPYAAEAIDVARELGDKWRLSQVLAWQAYAATLVGHPLTMAAAGEEGAPLAEDVGDLFMARMCRYWGVAMVRFQRGDVADGVEVLRDLLAAADASADVFHGLLARIGLAHALLMLGKYGDARAFAQEAVDVAPDLGPFLVLWAYAPLAQAALLDGDIATAAAATDVVRQWMTANPELAIANVTSIVELAFAGGELDAARRWADEAVSSMMGWRRTRALTTRARIAIAQGDPERAESDVHDALSLACEIEAYQVVPDALEILVELGSAAGTHREAARLVGAAHTIRQRQGGTVRFTIYEPAYAAALAEIRNAMGEADFDAAWA